MNSVQTKPKRLMLAVYSHVFGAVLLFVFALSHIVELALTSSGHHPTNSVFPFLTDWSMLVLAAAFEMVTAIVCIKARGRDLANLAILTFVLVIAWYRWALSYTTTRSSCHCLGVIAHLLHLTRGEEKAISLTCLVLLAAVPLPFVGRTVLGFARSLINRPQKAVVTLLFISAISVHAMAQDTVEINGTYVSYRRGENTGTWFTNETRTAAFRYVFSDPGWSIWTTNIGNSPTAWEGLVYDGTNTYTFMPESRTVDGDECTVRTTITPGSYFIRDYDEWLAFHAIWITYGLSPSHILTNSSGIAEIPMPWANARNNLLAYGAEWQVTPSPGGQFMASCKVVANTNLDLPDKEELLRPTLNFPEVLADRNHMMELLDSRHDIFPDGYVEATYQCTEWFQTNGNVFPKTADEIVFAGRWSTNYPRFISHVTATNILVTKGRQQLLPATASSYTLVMDYRYRRANEKHIYPGAQYVLKPGETWKPGDDKDILRTAEYFLKYGPAYGNYVEAWRRGILTWILLAAVLAIVILLGKKQLKRKAGDNNENPKANRTGIAGGRDDLQHGH